MIKDKELVDKILEMLETLIEASEYIKNCFENNENDAAVTVAQDMKTMLNSIYNVSINFNKEDKSVGTSDACKCILYSLENLLKNHTKAVNKIEFELIPFIKNTHKNLYLYGYIGDDTEQIDNFFDNELSQSYFYRPLVKSIETGKYKYDVSVIILAYNKLEYTKLCVESVLKYIPEKLKYELILVNHGSTDGTKDYFESIKPDKQVDVLINGSIVGAGTYEEGKYILNISNDVVVTQNAIENMVKCMESDEKIVKIVPTTTNVSNLQTIKESIGTFNDINSMHEFAARNNIYNPYRHEQRVRLCDPIALYRTDKIINKDIMKFQNQMYLKKNSVFPDDSQSLYFRRNKFKMILAKDAFCYHFGSITIRDEVNATNEQEYYLKGRKDFYNVFNIDPWGVGCCYIAELTDILPCNETAHVNILGINCGMGSNPLKIKETIKEKANNTDVEIYNVTDDSAYSEDLYGVSDNVKCISSIYDISKIYSSIKFKYIIWENCFKKQFNNFQIINNLTDNMEINGMLLIRIDNVEKKIIQKIKKAYKNFKIVKNFLVITKIKLEERYNE